MFYPGLLVFILNSSGIFFNSVFMDFQTTSIEQENKQANNTL